MGFFDLFKKKKAVTLEVTENTNNDYYNENFDQLTAEGELPFGWIYSNKQFTDKLRSEYGWFLQQWLDSRSKAPLQQYSALKSFVLYMQDAKNLCAQKGECFNRYREILFTDDYIEKRYNELKQLETNLDRAEEDYKRQQQIEKNVLPNLKKYLRAIIKENPGILQTDVYKHFDEDVKDYVSAELYQMNRSGKIYREKAGRTYKLYIK